MEETRMPKIAAPPGLSFTQACERLAVDPATLVTLREQGLVAVSAHQGRQVYRQPALDLTDQLLALGAARGWPPPTLAWYADLVFAAEVGRAILLPAAPPDTSAAPQAPNWLHTPYVAAVLRDLAGGAGADELITNLLRSVVAAAVGPVGFWPDARALERSALAPIIARLETGGAPIHGQGAAIARDAGHIFLGMLLAFTTIAPPISSELAELAQAAQGWLQGPGAGDPAVPRDEQALIAREALVAVDQLYAARAAEIHSAPDHWDLQVGVLSAQRRTVTLQMQMPLDYQQGAIDNIIDLIRPYVGTYGARVIQLLYEIANDAPYWRNPLITVDTNELLDRLGAKRDPRGIHRSKNRELLRNVLNAAHNLEIVGEYTTRENGRAVRKALRKTVLSLIGATFDVEESHHLTTEELFERGLPKAMQVRLNFYEGVRRPDGRLGGQYVLMPRLGAPQSLPKANHAGTHELLRAYLLLRARQSGAGTRHVRLTREAALEQANIRNKNGRMATQTLRKALERLVAEGTLESCPSVLPSRPQDPIDLVLTERAVPGPSLAEPAARD
jgi:hypothetical protein